MIKTKILAALLAIALPLIAAPAVMAQQTSEDKVLLKVNGAEIRVSDVRLAAEDLVEPLARVKPNERYIFVVQYLVERHLLAQEALKKGIEKTAGYAKLMEFYKAKAARDAHFQLKILPTITDQMVRAEYDKQAAAVDGQVRTRLANIQVEDEHTIKQIHTKLKDGADFAKLADENTPEGVATNGGDLGWFADEEMEQNLAAAVKGLEAGQISQPYKTKFGWNIAKVVERKTSEAQPFDKVQAGLKALLARKRVNEIVTELRGQANIEVIDPDLQKLQVKQ